MSTLKSFPYFLICCLLICANSNAGENEIKTNIIGHISSKGHSKFGILHTLKDLTEWAEYESENITSRIHFIGFPEEPAPLTNVSIAIMKNNDKNDGVQRHSKFGILHTLEDLTEWAAADRFTAKLLTQRQKYIDNEIKLIKSYLNDYHQSSGEAMKNLKNSKESPEERGKVVGSSAVLGHRMTSRYSGAIFSFKRLLTSDDHLDNKRYISYMLGLEGNTNSSDEESIEEHNFVKQSVGREDLYMSMTTFLHFQEVYGFEPKDMIEGLQIETTSGGRLHAIHCIELGMFSMYRRKYNSAIEWLQLTYDLLNEPDEENAETIGKLFGLVSALHALAIQYHNRDFEKFLKDKSENKLGHYDKYFSFYLDPIKEKDELEDRIIFRSEVYWNYKGLGERANAEAQFMDLCIGNTAQTPKMQKNLKCFYQKTRHPYLYINPVKVEHLSESPPVFQFYEMIGNETTEKIKEGYRGIVELSQLVGTTGIDDVTLLRTSASIGMVRAETPRMVYRLAEFLSGLNIWDSSEPIQFAEYTYGRYYTFHKDAFEHEKDPDGDITVEGDRLATMLYYLELPEIGGYTPFCQAGIYARPARGAAILWYNLYRNGSARQDVEHGACPVIHGHKIIMNHWIQYHENWNTFKCSLNQLE